MASDKERLSNVRIFAEIRKEDEKGFNALFDKEGHLNNAGMLFLCCACIAFINSALQTVFGEVKKDGR